VSPAEEIGTFARQIEADLIVVGHRRQSAFDRWWSGPRGAYLIVLPPTRKEI
jgi:nucleotide-binding universal stress UspA family protein